MEINSLARSACFHVIATLLILLTTNAEEAQWQTEAWLDTYYAYDSRNYDQQRRSYTTQAYHDQQLSINLAHLAVKTERESYRGRLALQYGDAVQSNYAAEPEDWSQYIQEAYLGYQLDPDTWIDAGVYFSHIGLESWISKDNINYTRSLVAEFSPYYQSGLKITHQLNPAWQAQLLILNGWQNISEDAHPALGTQLSYQISKKTKIISNSFIGEEAMGNRFFHDLLINTQLTDKLLVGFQFDYGWQAVSSEYQNWEGYALLAKYMLNSELALGMRIEYYSDPNEIIVSNPIGNGFQTWGMSYNLDYQLMPNMIWRNEVRYLQANQEIYQDDFGSSDHSAILVTALTYNFT